MPGSGADYAAPPLDLGGTWQALPATDDLRRRYTNPDLDDTGWEPMAVPGHWRSTPAFAASDGPVLQRRRFDLAPPDDGVRSWIALDGLFYQGDIWLDGAYVGDTEGYFVPHAFEVSDLLADRSEHLLAIEATCGAQLDPNRKRAFTGSFQTGQLADPSWNPGGIWRPLRVEHTGPVRIMRLRVSCTEADPTRAIIRLEAELNVAEATTVDVITHVAGPTEAQSAQELPLAAGTNIVEWRVTVNDPALWWPRALGPSPLHDVTVDVLVDGRSSDRTSRRTGLRQVQMHDWVLRVNGERMFVKGACAGPVRPDLAVATAEEMASDVQLAVDAGLDMLRLYAHVSRDELYDAADEAGLLLWQDLPLHWGYARGTGREAARQARAAVDVLGHHPSVYLWCGHVEPIPGDAAQRADIDAPDDNRRRLRRLIAGQLPTWNRTVLDAGVRRALEAADSSRPVIPHSGVRPHLPRLDGTDSHLYYGWDSGEPRDLSVLAARWPRLVRFVGEFGSPAVPDDADFCVPDRWPNLDWDRLAADHNFEPVASERRFPPGDFATFDAWRAATQALQAEVVKVQVEALRRLRYRPTGGFAVFALADTHPSIGFGLLDHARTPKLAWRALVDACRPVIAVADPLPVVVVAGDPLALDVHVISDEREPLGVVVVTARLSWSGGGHTWKWSGTVGPDCCVRVGTVQAVVADVRGPLELHLELSGAGRTLTNRYRSTIV